MYLDRGQQDKRFSFLQNLMTKINFTHHPNTLRAHQLTTYPTEETYYLFITN
jgi:hypothetical protein